MRFGLLKVTVLLTVMTVVVSLCAVAQPTAISNIVVIGETGGDHNLLARKATGVSTLAGPEGLVISIGSLLGPTRIVEDDKGFAFLHAARTGGIDILVPGIEEFRFGVERFGILSEYSDIPQFVSANIVYQSTRRRIVPPFVVHQADGWRVCVIGISDPRLLRDAADDWVRGIDVLPLSEAVSGIEADIRATSPDLVIAVGQIDHQSARELASVAPFIDMIMTTGGVDGFSGIDGDVTSAVVAGMPVYVAPKEPSGVSMLGIMIENDVETRIFTEHILPDDAPADEAVVAELDAFGEKIARRDNEEEMITRAGREISEILFDEFEVDAVILERQALFYHPLEDSLTIIDTARLIRQNQGLTRVLLDGSKLRAVHARSIAATNPNMRLHFAGITADARIDSIPIQDDHSYEVVTTPFLLGGGHGYVEVRGAEDVRPISRPLKVIVDRYLVDKDERIREAMREKLWTLKLFFKVGGNLTRTDVDSDKDPYGSRVPKPFRGFSDQFTGVLKLSSWNNAFTYEKGKQSYSSRLDMRYDRSGYRPEGSSVEYQESGDEIRLYNKYTYNDPSFVLKPYIDNEIKTEFYAPVGKHPIIGQVSAGVTRKLERLLGIVVNVGFSANRDYFSNKNSIGGQLRLNLDKSYPANTILTRNTDFHSEVRVNYKPMARYDNEFILQNLNNFTIQLWRRFDLTLHVNSYAYRNSTRRKVAIGFYYDLTLNYGMDWTL
jgi:hypothetical protein